MSATDDLIQRATAYAAEFRAAELTPRPARKVAVVACMDARLNLFGLLGLREGDAHVIRNAGGVVTDDTIRSLSISQRLLGTEEVLVVQHTDCGLLTVSEDEFKDAVEEDVGVRPEWALEAFTDLDENVRRSVAAIKSSPFIPHKDSVRGFVFDVRTGELREVDAV
jgi:carbonic anhydrase